MRLLLGISLVWMPLLSIFENWEVNRTSASSQTTLFGFWFGWIVKYERPEDALIVRAISSLRSGIIDCSAHYITFESFSSIDWWGFVLFKAPNSTKLSSWTKPMYVHGNEKLLLNLRGKFVRHHFYMVIIDMNHENNWFFFMLASWENHFGIEFNQSFCVFFGRVQLSWMVVGWCWTQ